MRAAVGRQAAATHAGPRHKRIAMLAKQPCLPGCGPKRHSQTKKFRMEMKDAGTRRPNTASKTALGAPE